MSQGVFYGELFGQLGLVLGTSQDPVTTYFVEPAFVNSTVGGLIWAHLGFCKLSVTDP